MASPLLTLDAGPPRVLDLHDLMKPGGPRRLFQQMAERAGQALFAKRPLMLVLDDFFSPSHVDALLRLAEKHVVPEDELPMHVRNVSKIDCETQACQLDPAVLDVYRQVERLVGLPAGNYESLEFLRYEPGQFYKPHQDSGDEEQLIPAGPRYLTAFGYLSDMPDGGGGGTVFPKAGITVTPKRGRLVVWSNVRIKAPWQDEAASLHAAERVTRGVKYAFNLWIHPRTSRMVMAADGDDCGREGEGEGERPWRPFD